MVQSKRLLAQGVQQEGERPKRQNSGDLRPRARRMSSEDSAYTTDETSDDEEEKGHPNPPHKTCKPPRRWQPSEDRRLAESVRQHGEANWKAIAARVGSRNHVQCLQRWKKVLRPGLVKGQWSSEEDAVLMKLASSGYKNWGVLSNHMPGRTSKQCRERWCHHLDPSINKGAYTPEEDRIIIETQAKIGNKWSQIAARLPGRTENSIKIRCKALQRRGGVGQSVVTSPRNSISSRTMPAAAALSRVTDAGHVEGTDERRGELIGASLENTPPLSVSHCLPQGKLVRSISPPPMCSPKPPGVTMPLSRERPMFSQGTSTGGIPSTVSSDSFAPVSSPFLDLSAPPPPVAPVDERYEDCLKWSRTAAPMATHFSGTLPVPSPMWSSSIATSSVQTVKDEQLMDHAPIAGSFMSSTHIPGPEVGSTVTPATPAPVFPRSCSGSVPDPSLSEYFALCATSIIGHGGVNHGQERECAGSLPVRMETSRSADVPGTAGGPIVKAETGGLEEDLGDLSTLDVKDLQAAVGGEDEIAPLRSCCSFLDLPGDGMVVGEMPLSW